MAIALRDISTFREERVGYSARSPSRSMDIWIRGGLVDPKHCRGMGVSVWLYLYLKSRAGFETGRVDRYTHAEAAEHLDESERTIRRWFDRLVAHGCVTVTHHRHSSTVEIVEFAPQSIRAAERRDRAKPRQLPDSSPATSARPETPRVDIFVHPETPPETPSPDTSVQEIDKNVRLHDQSNVLSNVSGSRDRGSSKDRSRRQSPPAAAFLIEPDIPPILQRFHPLLAGQRGYNPTPAHLAHLASIAQKLPALDLECEALKIIDWLDQSKNRTRQCSFAFVANWLKRAADDPSKSTNRASPPAPRPPDIEDGETYIRRLMAQVSHDDR